MKKSLKATKASLGVGDCQRSSSDQGLGESAALFFPQMAQLSPHRNCLRSDRILWTSKYALLPIPTLLVTEPAS